MAAILYTTLRSNCEYESRFCYSSAYVLPEMFSETHCSVGLHLAVEKVFEQVTITRTVSPDNRSVVVWCDARHSGCNFSAWSKSDYHSAFSLFFSGYVALF